VFGFVGPNGAGKSTTIKALVGLIRPGSGRVELFGSPVTDPAARRRIGYLPENPAFYDHLSASEYLHMVGRVFAMPAKDIRTEAERILQLVELSEAAHRPMRGFSKGMVQRLGLAQAMLHDPDLYILDEPMSGLDPIGRAMVKQIMLDLKARGKTVFFSTHVISDVEAVCDRVAMVDGGELRFAGAVREVIEKGTEGYMLQVAGAVWLEGALTVGEGLCQVYVPRDELNGFLRRLATEGGEVLLMEAQRRDLETFFLETVRRRGA
jgi:ABC-2 type transport system ATP-binding protein